MIGLPELIVLFVLYLPSLYALVDIRRSQFMGSKKVAWLILVILVPYIGPLAYFFIGRKQKIGT